MTEMNRKAVRQVAFAIASGMVVVMGGLGAYGEAQSPQAPQTAKSAAGKTLAPAAGPVRAAESPQAQVAREAAEKQHLTTRLDVKLAVESGDGMGKERLESLGQAAHAKMDAIKKCYAKTLQRDPTVEGELRLAASIAPKSKRPTFHVEQDTLAQSKLTQCVIRALGKIRVGPEAESANAYLTFKFADTAAKGAAKVQERMHQEKVHQEKVHEEKTHDHAK